MNFALKGNIASIIRQLRNIDYWAKTGKGRMR